ncbi:helix-turn-helix transcriptional regulator [Pseudomonas sp. JAI120]|uniref:helix-turn-helix transcriptional regulator n=1 Tax=Pseudomonas sp. JAI120 TaxID=2723063 RepID=UPI0030EBCEF3
MNCNANEIAQLVGSIGNSRFTSTFYNLCCDWLNIDRCSVFRINAMGLPECMIAEGSQPESHVIIRRLAQEYSEGGFRHDSNWPTTRLKNGHQTVYSIAPVQILDKAYRRRFYDEASVRHEVAVISCIDDQILYCSFFRNADQQDFDHKDIQHVEQLSTLLMSALGKHAEITQMREYSAPARAKARKQCPERRERMRIELRELLLLDPGKLTKREADICASIALGNTASGISLQLGISIHTVTTHRKRAYAKLRISCQNELFTRYFDSLQPGVLLDQGADLSRLARPESRTSAASITRI